MKTEAKTDNAKLTFAVKARRQAYGDGLTCYEYRVLIRRNGRVVGVVDGPRRTHPDRAACRRAGYAKIREMKGHPLYVIDVTRADIANGEAHSCMNCAIANALHRNQKRMGLDRYGNSFRVVPYACMADAEGIVLHRAWGEGDLATGDGMPDLVADSERGLFVDSMMEWAMNFDDWADSVGMTLAEWRDLEGDSTALKPCRPTPVSFVLDLATLRSEAAGVGGGEAGGEVGT